MSSVDVAEEREAPARAEEARRLRDPAVGIAPDRRAVLADGEVEAGVGEGGALGVAQMEGELEAELPLQATRRLELGRRVVDADGMRPASRQPGRDVGRAAAQLDRILPSRSGGSMPTADSGTSKMPQVTASAAQLRRPVSA